MADIGAPAITYTCWRKDKKEKEKKEKAMSVRSAEGINARRRTGGIGHACRGRGQSVSHIGHTCRGEGY